MYHIRSQLANRLLPGAAYRPAISGRVRWASQTATGEHPIQPSAKSDPKSPPAPPKGESEMISQEDAGEGLVDHRPDYHAPIDHGTS